MKIRNPFVIRWSAILFANLLRVLFWTVRRDLRTNPNANPYAASGAALRLYSVWHDSMVLAAFGGKHVRTIALTSQHRDGSFVANVLNTIRIPTVRGSTGHHGGSALRQIMTVARDKDIVMTPDGPRGPGRQMSRGIVFLASRTGRAIVPTAFSCEKCWRIRGSWSDLIIPKPFSRIYLLAGDPIEVPMDVPRDQLHEYVVAVQQEMDRLDEEARRMTRTSSSGDHASHVKTTRPAPNAE